MQGWFNRLVGREAERRPGRLAAMLEGYPPYRIPHPGLGWFLTLGQANENLAYLLAHKAERLGLIGGVMQSFGLDLSAGLAAGDPKPFMTEVWNWTAAEWPAIYDPGLEPNFIWLNSRREGEEVAYSLVQDLGIVLGEMVLVRRSDYAWMLDLDPDNHGTTPDDGMLSWQRPVVMRPGDGVVPAIQFDFEDFAFHAYTECSKPGFRYKKDMIRGVQDAVSGAREVYWREAARKAERQE